MIALTIVAVYLGDTGKHVDFAKSSNVITMSRAELKYLSLLDILYTTSIAIIKASILTMYYRILPTRFVEISVSVLGVIVFMWWFEGCLVTVFQCQPIQKAWGMSTLEGRCIDKGKWYFGAAVPNIVTDVAILTVPIYEIWRLRLPNAQKFAIASTFLLGGFVTIVSCIRARCVLNLHEGDNTDFISCVWWWSVVEISIGCVCACLPTLLPVIRFLFRHLRGRGGKGNTATKCVNGVATIGSSPTRRHPPTSPHRAGTCAGQNEEGASASDLYLQFEESSNDRNSFVSDELEPGLRNDGITMDTMTGARTN
ncbi:hypothetical protein N7509_000352 [Penicillium cosmopolitanum]|uniref:Rhodopsin domain-containing protein n=1 Tax=Penicillium cosmopolitanum TaxID=1131564 RepID=A0A9W9WA38_9EURO|nr:uncharacterized protein N7509_000352 [Penicillium cosmopolitanum]KAJ5413725.1 hypothetical protein N7509_000352 [Penicillium cosmopolitanum]